MEQPVIDPKYSIGIAEMDAQHARWIRLIQEFRATAPEQFLEPSGIEAARHALEQLLDYTRSHFASEERFIAAHHYPQLAQHQAEHRKLEQEVVKLLTEIRKHTTRTTPLKLNLFVTVWLMEHIMQEDIHYARFIRAGESAAPRPARPALAAS